MQDHTDTESKFKDGNPLDKRPVGARSTIHNVAEALSDGQDAYGPEEVGRYLRQIRMQRGISIRDVSNQIRIRPNQIEALEDGRLADLPGTVYSTGYVRAYAGLLGLDGEEAVRRFKQDAPLPEKPELELPVARREHRLPRPVLALSALLAGVIAYGGWLVLTQHSSAPRVADVPQHLTSTPEGSDTATSATRSDAGQQAPQTSSAEAMDPAPRVDPATDGVEQAAAMAEAPSEQPVTPESSGPVGSEVQTTEVQTTADTSTSDMAGEIALPETGGAGAEGLTEVDTPAVGGQDDQEDGFEGVADVTATIRPLEQENPAVLSQPLILSGTDVVTEVASETDAATATEDPSERVSTPAEEAPSVTEDTTASNTQAGTSTGRQLGQALDSRISIMAQADSYVQVRDVNGTLFLQRVLRVGDVYHVPDQSDLTLVTSNAGGLQVVVDGQTITPLGAVNEIVRGVALDPVALGATTSN